MTKINTKQFFTLAKLLQIDDEQRQSLVRQYSSNRTASLKELSIQEFKVLISALQNQANNLPSAKAEEEKRKALLKVTYALCYDLEWVIEGDSTKLDFTRISNWMTKYGVAHKKLNQYSSSELNKVNNQLRNIAHKNNTKGNHNQDE